MATVFWDRKGLLMVEFMQRGTTILSKVYCDTKKLHRVIKNKRCGMLTYCIVLLHAYAHPYTTAHTLAVTNHFNRELCDYPPYSPKLLPPVYLPEELVLITSQAYRNLFPNMTSTTFPAVTMLRSG
jgi:hypothetical protein